MTSIHEKILVAENCNEYEAKNFITVMSYISQGCSSCVSYIDNSCAKELFEEINEKIRVN